MKQTTHSLVLSALFAALCAVCSQIAIPLPMVPINFALFAVHLSGAILSSYYAFLSTSFSGTGRWSRRTARSNRRLYYRISCRCRCIWIYYFSFWTSLFYFMYWHGNRHNFMLYNRYNLVYNYYKNRNITKLKCLCNSIFTRRRDQDFTCSHLSQTVVSCIITQNLFHSRLKVSKSIFPSS